MIETIGPEIGCKRDNYQLLIWSQTNFPRETRKKVSMIKIHCVLDRSSFDFKCQNVSSRSVELLERAKPFA